MNSRNSKKDNKSNKLIYYLCVSLLIHLVLIYFFPMGALRGVADGEGTGMKDYGFVQYVELKRVTKTESETVSKNNEKKEQEDEEKEKTEKKEPEKPTQPEKKEEVEKKEESKVNIKEEKSEPDQPEEKTVPEKKQEPEEQPVEQKTEETKKSEKSTSTPQENDVLTSDDSELEIEKKNEEEKAKKPPAAESSSEKKEEKNEKTEEETETHNETEQESENGETESQTPPPPPSAGDLVGLSPNPTYPKYLVSEAKKGKVNLRAHISSEGEVEKVEIINSSNYDSMDKTSLLTIKKGWKFKKYSKPYAIKIEVNYDIDKNGNPTVDVKLSEVKFK